MVSQEKRAKENADKIFNSEVEYIGYTLGGSPVLKIANRYYIVYKDTHDSGIVEYGKGELEEVSINYF